MESKFEAAIQQYVDLGFPSVLLILSKKKKKRSKDIELRIAHFLFLYE